MITEKFRKDTVDEKFLEKFNSSLVDLEEKYIYSLKPSDKKILFICGAPRSGTTFLSQVLARTGAFNYATNFVARFWRAPFVGLYLEKLMGIREMAEDNSFDSNLGRTKGIVEPHEFTYFWEYWLKPGGTTHVIPASRLSDIDVKGVNREINSMLAFYDKPIFFKTHLTMINPLVLHKIFKNAYFVVIDRNVLSNALSIFIARKKYFDNTTQWWSIKPSNYQKLKKLPTEEQIIGQINGIYSDIDNQISDFRHRTMNVSYEQLCTNPRRVVDKITGFMGMKKIARSELKKNIPESFAISNKKYSMATINRFKKQL